MYAESTFLLLSLLFFYFLFGKRVWLAGLFGMLAALTRITGLFLFIPFIMELWSFFKRREIKGNELLSSFLIPAGTAAFFVFHWIRFGDFFAYLKTQSSWGRNFVISPDHIFFGTSSGIINSVMDIIFVLIGLVGAYFVYRYLRKSYGIYIISVIVVSLLTGTLLSMGRIMLVLFPLFIYLATVKKETFKLLWIPSSTLLLALYTLLYVSNYWAG